MTEKELLRVHELELVIAEEIKRLCTKHHISYFMIAGTLLGAVRHGGFIPWDEDMDFGMTRKNYDRFVRICQKELDSSRFFLQTMETDPGYTYAFAKIRLLGTVFTEALAKDSKAANGIFVDIFPFDHVPKNRLCEKLHERERYLWKNMLAARLGYGNGAGRSRILRAALFLVSRILPADFIRARKKIAFTRYNNKPASRLVTAEGSYRYMKEKIPVRYIRNLIMMPFENTEFPAFAEFELYLGSMYGDYMKLPPEDQRNKHNILGVDFGPYEI